MSEHLANDVEKEKDAHLEHVHDANVAIIHQAISAERDEQMGVLKALRIFPRATFWSFMVSFCIVSRLYQEHGADQHRSWKLMTLPSVLDPNP